MESKAKASHGTYVSLSPSESVWAEIGGLSSKEETPGSVKRRNLGRMDIYALKPSRFIDQFAEACLSAYQSLKESPQEEILEQLKKGYPIMIGDAGLEQVTLSIRAESSKPAQPAPGIQDAIEAYLTDKADGGAAEGYLKVQRRKLQHFARRHPQLPTSPKVIREYLRQFKTGDVPTRKDQWMALSMLYKFVADTYGVPNPMLKIDKPRFRKKSGQRLSRDQARLLLVSLRTDLEWALITCYFGLRFRLIEAERLSWGHIKSDYLIVQGKERTEELPLLPVFRDRLLRLFNNHRPSDPLFSMKADTMGYHISQIFKRAGIVGVRGSAHTLRNTAGALWSTFGGDWTSNRQLLRHSAKTMTDHYSPLMIDELRAKDECHNPMLNLMRELDLVAPQFELFKPYQNITGGQVKSIPSSIHS